MNPVDALRAGASFVPRKALTPHADPNVAVRQAAESARPALRDEFLCPLSLEPMADPCTTADGYTYERAAIERWLRTSDVSPRTGCRLPHKELTPNLALRHLIAAELSSTGRPR